MTQFPFHGAGGSLIVSLIAFTIVFAVLAGLSATIYANRYIAMIFGKKNAPKEKTVSSAAVDVPAPASKTVESDNDMKKVVAAISAAINASSGRNVNILRVTPTQAPSQGNCLNMTPVWRVTGIAECMESRLGSRSW
jgi:Na+-transporting methylmalonyl-CoA/oxaloacetate decarboxylase gamma subunit